MVGQWKLSDPVTY